MKHVLKTAIATLALAGAVAVPNVSAADLHKSLKDTPEVEALKKADFAGAYVGIALGGAMLDPDGAGNDFSGAVGEIMGGYDFRRGSIVFGPRIRGALTTLEDDANAMQIDGYINLGGRAGLVFNRTLVYGSLGYEFISASSDTPALDAALDDANLRAWTLGVGAETRIFDGLTAGAEFEYVKGTEDAKDLDGPRVLVRFNRHF